MRRLLLRVVIVILVRRVVRRLELLWRWRVMRLLWLRLRLLRLLWAPEDAKERGGSGGGLFSDSRRVSERVVGLL